MKRYDEGYAGMLERSDGEWIRYSDHIEAMRIAGEGREPVLTEDQIAVRAGIPFVGLSVQLVKALKRLSFAAQTSGGTAGRDDELMGAILQAQDALEASKGKGLEECAAPPEQSRQGVASGEDEDDEDEDGELIGDQRLIAWDKFPGWLIDHHEGETITEEGLQHALAAMLKVHPPVAATASVASPAALTDAERDSARYLNMIAQPGFLHYPELKAINAYLQRAAMSASKEGA